MLEEITILQKEASEAIQNTKTAADLENVRLTFLSKKGALSQLLEKLKTVPPDQKPSIGKRLNEIKKQLETLFETHKEAMESQTQDSDQDLTLPGRPYPLGKLHPLTQITDKIITIFRRMGFALAEGPDIETEFYNFDALNTPPDHPARNEKDTFYLNRSAHPTDGRYLLRTQTSPVQIRVMQNQKPPLRIICPGRCYRRDEIDATHSTSFHQIEGLVVNENVSLADLKGTLEFFFKELLGPETRMRLRPHFFPFTEPSFEVDLNHPTLNPKGKKWLEIAGCGMVDPNVFQSVGYDPERYTGFAFGMGIERIAMILQGVPDLRLYEQNDLRFLSQF